MRRLILMRLRLIFLSCLLCFGVGCTEFPDLDGAVSEAARDAPYPDLLPVEELNARISDPRITPETVSGLAARVAALKARAARLRGSVIDSPTRERMSIGVTGT